MQVVGRGNNTITLDVTAAADGVLVLSEVAYPGWRVFVDGERVSMVRADYTLRAVCVPAGTHRITFSFWPASLVVGAIVTVLAWLLVVWAAWQRRRSGGERGYQDNKGCAEVAAPSTGAGNGGERGYQDNNGCAEVVAPSTGAGNGGGM